MKNLNKIKSILLTVSAAVVLFSCMARQPYQRPENIAETSLFRHGNTADSTGLGHLSWKTVFTDPILQKHISDALAKNLDLQTAVQNIVAAEAYLTQARAAYYPGVSAITSHTVGTSSLNSTTSSASVLSSNSRRYVNSFNLSGSVNWELDIWGRLNALEKAQRANYFELTQARNAVMSDIVSGVATLYYNIQGLDDQKRILLNTIETRKKNLETTKALKDSGILTEVAVQQSEALVYNAESQIISIDTQIENYENSLNLLKGETSKAVERATLDSQNPQFSTNVGYPTSLLSNRPDVMQAEFGLMDAFHLKNAARAAFYPTLSLTGSGGLQGTDIDKLFNANSLFASLVSGLTQPIFNKRQIRTNYEVAETNRQKAYLNFRKTVLTAGIQVSNAVRSFTAQDEYISLKMKELQNYRNAVEYSQQLVNYGMTNYLDVLTAEINRLNTELTVSSAKVTKLNAGVELYRALGGGWQ